MKLHEIVRTRRTAIFYSIVVIALISAIAFVTWPESREVRRTADSTDNAFAQSPQISRQSPNNDRSGLISLEAETPSDAPIFTNPVPEPIDTVWDKYHDAASSGDAQAAYLLASFLATCERVIRSLPSHDPNELKTHAEMLSPPGNTEMVGELMALFENCRATHERLESAADWMMLAAENGSIDAMLEYLTVARSIYEPADEETRDRYYTNAITFLNKARNRGNLQAAMQLSRILRNRDSVAAYANSVFIITSLQTGRINPDSHHMGGYIESANHIMEYVSHSMTEREYERAMLLADELLLSCCD